MRRRLHYWTRFQQLCEQLLSSGAILKAAGFSARDSMASGSSRVLLATLDRGYWLLPTGHGVKIQLKLGSISLACQASGKRLSGFLAGGENLPAADDAQRKQFRLYSAGGSENKNPAAGRGRVQFARSATQLSTWLPSWVGVIMKSRRWRIEPCGRCRCYCQHAAGSRPMLVRRMRLR